MLEWINKGENPYDACKRIASNYDSLNNWANSHRNSYRYALKKNWHRLIAEEYNWGFRAPYWIRNGESSYDACKRWANKYSNLTCWQSCHFPSYNFARQKHWTKKIASELNWQYLGVWTFGFKSNYEACLHQFKKYKSKSDWDKFHPSSYAMACKNNWLEKIYSTENLKVRRLLVWVNEGEDPYDACKRIASKYRKLNIWYERHQSSYAYALRRGWHLKIAKELNWHIGH